LIILSGLLVTVLMNSCQFKGHEVDKKPEKIQDSVYGPKFKTGTDQLSVFLDCSGKLVRENKRNDAWILSTRRIDPKGDTIPYVVNFNDMNSFWRESYSEPMFGVIGDKIFMATLPYLTLRDEPHQVLLIDLSDEPGVKRDIGDYFQRITAQISFKEKRHNKYLNDTLYHYTISGQQASSHPVAVIDEFVYSTKLGFIRFDYCLEGRFGKCKMYAVLKEFEKYFVDAYEKGER
jgi:hypothetical protein